MIFPKSEPSLWQLCRDTILGNIKLSREQVKDVYMATAVNPLMICGLNLDL